MLSQALFAPVGLDVEVGEQNEEHGGIENNRSREYFRVVARCGAEEYLTLVADEKYELDHLGNSQVVLPPQIPIKTSRRHTVVRVHDHVYKAVGNQERVDYSAWMRGKIEQNMNDCEMY